MNENSPTEPGHTGGAHSRAHPGGPAPLRPIEDSSPCPCGSGDEFGQCCAPIHADPSQAVTAEQLMRSRFTAFVTGNAAHLFRTWAESTRPSLASILSDMDHEHAIAWKRLLIRDTELGGEQDASGIVEFIAIGRDSSRRIELAERSRFEREAGPRSAWVYVDGDLLNE